MHNERYVMLDGLRGMASLSVFIFHAWMLGVFDFYLSRTSPTWFETAVLNRGGLGVEVFFVLSGFVMAHSQRNAELSWRSLGRFVLRRSLRLDPPFYIATGLMMLTIGVLPAWRTIAFNAVYAQGIAGVESILPPGWSLAYEAQFYVVLFLILATSHRLGGERVAQLSASVLAVVSFAWFVRGYEDYRGWFLNLWFMFWLGMMAYWTVRGLNVRWFALAIILLLSASVARNNHFARERVFTGVLTAGLIVMAGERGKLAVWLSNAPTQFFGRISYSLYLLHWPIFLLAVRWVPGAWCPAAALPFAVGAAWLMRVAIEQPGMELGRRLASPPRRRVGAPLRRQPELVPEAASANRTLF
jgi:peptidoglycan/LPS O-acetylase OafA/YrhL